MAFNNPFKNDNEETSFEQGMPVTQAAKTAVKAAAAQTQKQADDTVQKIVDELYAPSTPQEPGTDEANVQHNDQSNAATRAASTHAAISGHAGNQQNVPLNQTEDQAKMEKIRRELFGNYSGKFQSAPNGAQNITTNLEQEMEKARQERKRKEEERKREQEEEERRKLEEEQQKQELEMPSGKKTGFTMGKKQQQPIALQQAKTRTEITRGTSG